MRSTQLNKYIVLLFLATGCSNGSDDKSDPSPKNGAQPGVSNSSTLPGGASNANAAASPTPAASATPALGTSTPAVLPTPTPIPSSAAVTPGTPLNLQLVFDGGGASCETWNVQVALDAQSTGALTLSSKDGFDSADTATLQTSKLLVISGQTKGRIAHVNFTAPAAAIINLTSSLLLKCNSTETNKDETNSSSVIITPGLVKPLISHGGMSLTLTSGN